MLSQGFKKLIDWSKLVIVDFKKMEYGAGSLMLSIGALSFGVMLFVSQWKDMSPIQRAVGIFVALASAITATAIALHTTHNWAKALMVGATVTGGALTTYSALMGGINMFANGGMPDKGTMFVAGEAGAEIVYNTPSGQSGVANIKQIEQAMFNALTRASKNGTTVVEIDGQKIFTVVKQQAKSNGYTFAKV